MKYENTCFLVQLRINWIELDIKNARNSCFILSHTKLCDCLTLRYHIMKKINMLAVLAPHDGLKPTSSKREEACVQTVVISGWLINNEECFQKILAKCDQTALIHVVNQILQGTLKQAFCTSNSVRLRKYIVVKRHILRKGPM